MTFQDHMIKGSDGFMGRKLLLIVYPHPTEIGSHRHSVHGYLIILVCHVILQNCLIIWSFDFMGERQVKVS